LADLVKIYHREMNYLGAEPARYQLRNHNFLSNIEFNLECPPFPAGIPVGEGGNGG